MIVVCVACGAPIYDCLAVGRDHAGAKICADDFIPVKPEYGWPRDGSKMTCPLCGEGFAFNDDGVCLLRLETGAWWPHPPVRSQHNSVDNDS